MADEQGFEWSGSVDGIPDGGEFRLEVRAGSTVIDTLPIAVRDGQWVIDAPGSRTTAWPDVWDAWLIAQTPGGEVATEVDRGIFRIVASGDQPTDPGQPSSSTPIAPKGFGSRNTTYGNNGRIITVTNLNDSGPGSFRDAVEVQMGERYVEFDVSGTIQVPSEISLINPAITIDGSTAPGNGIRLQATPGNSGFVLRTTTTDIFINNVGMYHHNGTGNVDNRDVLNISKGSYRVCVSQCTFMWGADETVSIFHSGSDVGDITLQYCLIAEGLDDVGHSKGRHSKGVLATRALPGITILGCIFTGMGRRNPRVDGQAQVINCVAISSGGGEFRPLSFGKEVAGSDAEYDFAYNRVIGTGGPEKGALIYPQKLFEAGEPTVFSLGNIDDQHRTSNSQPERDWYGSYNSGNPENLNLVSSPHHPDTLAMCTHTDATGTALHDYLKTVVGAHSWNRHPNDQRVIEKMPDPSTGTIALTNTAVQLY